MHCTLSAFRPKADMPKVHLTTFGLRICSQAQLAYTYRQRPPLADTPITQPNVRFGGGGHQADTSHQERTSLWQQLIRKTLHAAGHAVSTAVKSLLSLSGLGATTLTPTTRTAAITTTTMDSVWRMPNPSVSAACTCEHGTRYGELIADGVYIRNKERRAINLHARQLCAGTWSGPPVELRNPPTKAAISSKPVGPRISKPEAGRERAPPKRKPHLALTNGVKR